MLLSPVSATIKPLSLTPGTAGLGFKEVVFTSDQVNANDPSVLWKVSGAPLGIPMGNTGKYVGKPTTPGNFTLSVFVYVKVGGRLVLKDSTKIKHTINATTPPTINGSFTLPSAQYDQRYQQVTGGYRLTASGDYPFPRNSPYPNGFLWAAIPGASTFQSLPQGLILSPDGVISGVPTGSAPIPASNQTYTFKAKATDLVGKFSIATFTLTILRAEPPEILSACPLPEGLELFTYPAVTLKGAKGKINYSWSVSPAASFPPGLKLDPSTGIISGKPTLKGLFNFEIILRDKNGLTANKSCSINIRPAPEIIKKQIFSCVRVGDTLYEEIEARGGDQPYTWSVIGGAPPGIGIVQSSPSKGKIGGTFTTAGFFQVNIKAAEKGSRVDIEQFSFEVRPALGITTSSPLPFGIRGFAYPGKAGAQSVKIEPSGGWAPYSWQLLSGQLPLGLSISPSTGVISGTPAKTGTFKFTVRIKDSCKTPEKWVDKEFEIVIYDPITIFSDPIPCLTINKTFSSSITASGGASPYTWQIVSSTSPSYQISVPSAANSKVAQLSGVPEQVGPVALTVSVTSLGMTESFTINHTVNPELQITSACPPSEMTVGNASSHSFSAIGGKGNYTWSINQTLSTNGTFPAGLILSGNKITGTPSVPAGGFPTGGDSSGAGYTIAVDVRDECGNTATKVCSATLYPALENPIAAQLCLYDGLTLNGTQLFSVSGGKPPYTWGAANGLPSGLTLSSNGSLSGTINGAGNFTVSATATDRLGNTKSATCVLTILPKLAITTPSPLPVAYIGSNYSTTINATGGKPCYSWTLNSTSIDPQDFVNLQIGNLTCNSSTTVISGIPQKVGNYTFTVNSSDSCGQIANQSYTIEVNENKILACLKEIWVVVDYSNDGSHKCNNAAFDIFANSVKTMLASVNNDGGTLDWANGAVKSPSAPATFIFPHREDSDRLARWNEVRIDGALLVQIASSSSNGVVSITASGNTTWAPGQWSASSQFHQPIGRLRVYTSQVPTGIFSKSTLKLIVDTDSPDIKLNRGYHNNFKVGIEVKVDVCETITLNSTSSLQVTSSSISEAATSPSPLPLINHSSMALVSSNLSVSSLQSNNLITNASFKISNFEITNQLYADFLNATAKTDLNNLYNTSMQDIGINRNATSGNYTYSIDSGKENYPVTYVSWYDAARYTNWLANGKPNAPQSSGTTENGAYNLGSSTIVRNSINPNTGVPPTNWLLNESEWYTSAYLKSNASALWTYPTQSNTAPDASGSNPSNFANFGGLFGETTPVGFLDQSPGPFGTFDQGGNVREWTETNDSNSGNAMRIIRGGSWADPASAMRADESQIADPSLEDDKTGFRIGGAP